MDNGKVILGVVGLTATIGIIYGAGFYKGKDGLTALERMKSKHKLTPTGKPNLTAEDAGTIVKVGADGMGVIHPAKGNSFGNTIALKEIKNNNGVVIAWTDKNGVKWTKA